MTMPKGWKPRSPEDRSSVGYENQFSRQPEETEYRNPIPPGYMPTSPPPSKVAWPSSTTRTRESSRRSNIAIVIIIAVILILVVAIFTGPYTLIMIPIVVIGLLRGLGRGSGMNQYRDNMSRRGRRSK